MVVLWRELERQRLTGTADSDCFPSSAMDTVLKYVRKGMELKAAGEIAKYSVVNMEEAPVLQTGEQNSVCASYRGH
jgi:hypothetical protein